MKRRDLLKFGASAAAFVLAGQKPAVADLEPDGLWPIYRRYRLLIVGQRDDEIASAFAGAVADVLARSLPPRAPSWPAQWTPDALACSLARSNRTSQS